MRMSMGRRRFLWTTGGGALALPFLEYDLARGAEPAVPTRFVIYQTGEGTLGPRWLPPTRPGDALELSELLAPLAAHRDQLVVVSGVSNLVSLMQLSTGGHNGPGHTLLSASLVDTTGVGRHDPNIAIQAGHRCLGPSIDHYLASRLNTDEPLNLAAGMADPSENRMFYRVKAPGVAGANPEAPLEYDPAAVFARLLGGAPQQPVDTRASRFAARREAVVGGVIASFGELKTRLGSADRLRVDEHLAALRDLSGRLTAAPPPAACAGATFNVPAGFKIPVWPDYPGMNVANDLMVELMVRTLSCGARRIVTFQDTHYDSPRFEFLPEGPIEGWHAHVHNDPALGLGLPSNNENPKLRAGFLYYAKVFASLLSKMRAVVEPNGKTMLENSLVLWISEFGSGQTHDTRDLPVVLAGGAGGAIVTGRHLARPNATTGDLFTSILNAFGVMDRTFGETGDASLNHGGIAGLLA